MKKKLQKLFKKNQAQLIRLIKVIFFVGIILAAVVIALLFYRQKIEVEVPREVKLIRNITEDWNKFKSEKYGFEFKYPQNLTVNEEKNGILKYTITDKENGNNNINIYLTTDRNVDNSVADAIQVSIPYDKKSYLVFTTSIDNKNKEIFYNILATLK